MKLSVIIPTLNEEKQIYPLLRYLKQLNSSIECIVSDSGSMDGTVSAARKLAKVIESPRGRGVQMNTGAFLASGDVLWFLHADCRPHPKSIQMIESVLQEEAMAGGAFRYSLDVKGFQYRLAEGFSNLKNRIFSLLYGDMGIFVRSDIFRKMGGYRNIPIMEDMDFSRRLKEMGEVVILPYAIQTSARRWVEDGYVKSCLRSWFLQSAWFLGASPEYLARWYPFQ